MKLPQYLTDFGLAKIPFEYEWDHTFHFTSNSFLSITDDDDSELAKRLIPINSHALFALGIACCEWIAARFQGHVATFDDAILRIEAAWVATQDHRIVALTNPAETKTDVNQDLWIPMRLSMKLLYISFEKYRTAGEDFMAMNLAMLARHLVLGDVRFARWLDQAIEKAQKSFPRTEDLAQDHFPVPIGFFNPEWKSDKKSQEREAAAFIAEARSRQNPYLRSGI